MKDVVSVLFVETPVRELVEASRVPRVDDSVRRCVNGRHRAAGKRELLPGVRLVDGLYISIRPRVVLVTKSVARLFQVSRVLCWSRSFIPRIQGLRQVQ